MKVPPNLPHIRTLLLAFTLGTASVVASAEMAQAQTASGTTFSCQTNAGVPTTMVHTPRGEVLPIIRWRYQGFRGWSPEQRCQEVSRRFHEYKQREELTYLTTGRMNGQNVICTTPYHRGRCTGLLLTVRPGVSPNQTLQALLNVQKRAIGAITEADGRIYIAMDEIIENARLSQHSNHSNMSDAGVSVEEISENASMLPPGESSQDPLDALW